MYLAKSSGIQIITIENNRMISMVHFFLGHTVYEINKDAKAKTQPEQTRMSASATGFLSYRDRHHSSV